MEIEIKQINKSNSGDINIPNEPFLLCGKMLPTYNGKWNYSVVYFEKNDVSEMTFPNENYDYEKLAENSFFVGAYADNVCIGLAIYQNSWNKYLYLYDLKVNAAYRHSGVGKMLINEGKAIALENGYNGIYTQGQDNNLIACLFYIKAGFHIGGLDTDIYKGTMQEGKADIVFYLDIDK